PISPLLLRDGTFLHALEARGIPPKRTYPRPLSAALSFVHPRRPRGSDAGPGGAHRMEKAISCGGRKLAAGPAITAPPESRPFKQAGGVTGGPWLPLYKKVESKAAR